MVHLREAPGPRCLLPWWHRPTGGGASHPARREGGQTMEMKAEVRRAERLTLEELEALARAELLPGRVQMRRLRRFFRRLFRWL